MAQVFYCNWGGTDVLNTSPPSGESAYNNGTDEPTIWERIVAAGGWNGDAAYARATTKASGKSSGISALSITNKLAFRFMFYVATLGMNSGQLVTLARFLTGGATSNGGVRVKNNSGTPQIIGQGRNASNVLEEFGSVDIEVGKWYQIEMIYQDNTASGASYKVWNETGDTQIGTTQTCSFTTFDAASLTSHYIGCITGVTGSDNVFRFNRHTIWDDNTFPGPIVVSLGNPYYAYQQQQ